MRLYRCMLCPGPNGTPGRDFEGDEAVCPQCHAGSTPRTQGAVVQRVLIHYDAPSRIPHVGVGHPACNPAANVVGLRASVLTVAVTCQACRETKAFKDAERSEAFDPAYDAIPAAVDAGA